MKCRLRSKLYVIWVLLWANDLRDVTYRILRTKFTPKVAVDVNFEGHGEKLGFSHFKLIKVVHKAIHQNATLRETSDKDIDRRVMFWLRVSANRNGGQYQTEDA